MARASKPRAKGAKLPNAPLVEAVFELRWQLPGPSAETRMLLQTDPGFLPALETFSKQISRKGYPASRDMTGPNMLVGPYSVARRFFVAPDAPFPIMQIGPGIFATNQATEYEWHSFKKQILTGVRLAVASYPSLPGFPLRPNYLELRYVDAFDATLVGTVSFADFLNKATTADLGLPPFLSRNKKLVADIEGRVILTAPLKGQKSSALLVDIGSGTRQGAEKIIRMETKVVSRNQDVPSLNSVGNFVSEVGAWVEDAHELLSLLFKELAKPEVMEKFKSAR